MSIREVIETVNKMQEDGVITGYAIGGAVGATFYLQPIATVDVDIFVGMTPAPGNVLIDPRPIFNYLTARGCVFEGEYIMVADWPVQFLAPAGLLVDEALDAAVESAIEGVTARVFSAEYLAAICLQTGRAKDKARLSQFVDSGVLDMKTFLDILDRHALTEAWAAFEARFRAEGI